MILALFKQLNYYYLFYLYITYLYNYILPDICPVTLVIETAPLERRLQPEGKIGGCLNSKCMKGGMRIKVGLLPACMIIALLAAAMLAVPPATSAKTLTVGPGGSYKTIQSAVNAASAGDTILVGNGVYRENVRVNKKVTIRAASGAKPAVDAGKKYPAFLVSAGAWIEGFTISGGGALYAGILRLGRRRQRS